MIALTLLLPMFELSKFHKKKRETATYNYHFEYKFDFSIRKNYVLCLCFEFSSHSKMSQELVPKKFFHLSTLFWQKLLKTEGDV